MPLSTFFEQLGRYPVSGESGAYGSIRDLCDLIHRFLADAFPGRELLADALSFDYCRAEYPSPDRLPACFGDVPGSRETRGTGCPGDGVFPAGARIRRFRRRFLRNYLDPEWGAGPVDLLFTYCALQGEGERVDVTCPA